MARISRNIWLITACILGFLAYLSWVLLGPAPISFEFEPGTPITVLVFEGDIECPGELEKAGQSVLGETYYLRLTREGCESGEHE